MTGRRSRLASMPTITMMKVAVLLALGLATTQAFTYTTTPIHRRRLSSSPSSSASSIRMSMWRNSQRQFSVLPLYQSSDASTPTPVNNTASTTTVEAVDATEVASNTHDKNPDSLKNMLKFAIPALGIYLSNPMLSNIDNGT
mmetsp:Transcript_12460/g.25177  ORF Transcript_12460/g.25177 Transcript_12460/m.25177 type:complete len:142 (+) Transcript_12460:64-489(+)